MNIAFEPDKLRQRNVLNPTEEGMLMVLPTFLALNPRMASVPLHDELLHADRYAEWTVLAVFCCPAILIRPEARARVLLSLLLGRSRAAMHVGRFYSCSCSWERVSW